MRIDIVSIEEDGRLMEFDLVGVDTSLANAFRRILVSEVPTMAIEKVLIYDNTSLIQDEVFAHRLGLIPIYVDPRKFKFKEDDKKESLEEDPESTIVFELKIKCTKNPQASPESTDHDELYINHNVYTRHLKWIPIGNQAAEFADDPIRPVEDDILIAKLRPGQNIDIRLLCFKGTGSDHAKFSPVAPASYRLHPRITLLQPIQHEWAEKLQGYFSEGVIAIDRSISVTIESTGALAAEVLMCEAIKILTDKCDNMKKLLDSVT